jgi:hypothetical protein
MADERPKIELPPEFKGDENEFLRCMRQDFSDDQEFDSANRIAGIEDLQFVVGDQWDELVAARRQAKRKPVLTVNRLPAFVAQVVGSRLQNETEIKVLPDSGGNVPIANVREGLIRSIQKLSDSETAYDNALTGAVCCGIGNWQIDIDYENDEVWHMSPRIHPIADHFSVVWDRTMTDPTGRDATRCFVIDRMPEDTFRAEYPWATPTDIISDRMPAELRNSSWYMGNDVQIVAYWAVRRRKRMIALLTTGQTVDITDEQNPAVLGAIDTDSRTGQPMVREIYRKYVQMYRCSGADILEGPYELSIDRVPVFRVPGWVLRIGATTHRWGIVRNMKDPQRLHNYWRSAIAEKIMQSPKNTWVASDTAVAGREAQWRASGTSDDPLLIWNAESGQPPVRNAPVQIEEALIAEAATTTQDLKDVSNIHEANLGMPSNEVSGVAIQRRQAVSDTGTQIYHVNLTKAIRETGRVLNELIPYIYDTKRTISVTQPDGAEQLQAINDSTNSDAVDLTVGKYRITASVGPSFATKRQENEEAMLALAQAMPQTFAVAPDLLVEAMDWPLAPKIAARFRRALPPGVLGPDEMTPEMQQQAVAAGQQQQQATELAVKKAMAEFMKDQSESILNFARAQHYATQTQLAPQETQNETIKTLSEAASRESNDSVRATTAAIRK